MISVYQVRSICINLTIHSFLLFCSLLTSKSAGGVTSMDPFLKKFFPEVYEKENNVKPSDNQYCKFDSQTLTLFTSSLYLAALFASVLASYITRLFGRRLTMFLGGVLFLVGALFNAFAQNVTMLILGRMFLGFGIGCANQVIYTYMFLYLFILLF